MKNGKTGQECNPAESRAGRWGGAGKTDSFLSVCVSVSIYLHFMLLLFLTICLCISYPPPLSFLFNLVFFLSLRVNFLPFSFLITLWGLAWYLIVLSTVSPHASLITLLYQLHSLFFPFCFWCNRLLCQARTGTAWCISSTTLHLWSGSVSGRALVRTADIPGVGPHQMQLAGGSTPSFPLFLSHAGINLLRFAVESSAALTLSSVGRTP